MLKEIISQGNFAIWPQISLVLFLIVFTAIVLWVKRKASDGHYQHMASLTQEELTGLSHGSQETNLEEPVS